MLTLEYLSSLRQGLTDAQIIGSAKQPGDDFVDVHETYTWYRAVGCARAPKSILELGVRYGYALIAIAKGSISSGVISPYLVGVDSESDGISSNHIAIRNVTVECGDSVPLRIFRQSTQNISATGFAICSAGTAYYDIVHVDGDHSHEGIQRELTLALAWIAPDGWILIDDIDTPHIKDAADKFCESRGIIPLHIPTFHGMYLVDMVQRTE